MFKAAQWSQTSNVLGKLDGQDR